MSNLNLATATGYNITMSRPAGFKHSEATKLKIREAKLGQKMSEEARRNNSLAHIGIPSPFKNRVKLNCQHCNNPYEVAKSRLYRSKYCSRKCTRTAIARKQHSYPPELIRLEKVWREMRNRCSNFNNQAYKNYGGRGIRVCEEWLDINTFISDVLPTYESGLTLDRINNDGNYEPGNVRWATYKQQANNRRTRKKQ